VVQKAREVIQKPREVIKVQKSAPKAVVQSHNIEYFTRPTPFTEHPKQQTLTAQLPSYETLSQYITPSTMKNVHTRQDTLEARTMASSSMATKQVSSFIEE